MSLWHRLEQLLADDETEGEGAPGEAPELDLPTGTSGGAGTPGELLPPRELGGLATAPAAPAGEVEPGEPVGAPERTPPPPPPASSGLPVVIGSTPQPLSGAAPRSSSKPAPSAPPVIVAEHAQPAYPTGPPPEVASSWEQPSSEAAHTMATKHIRNRHRGHHR